MKVNYQGNCDAQIVLLQIIGEHELPLLEEELSHIKAITQSTDFLFITVQVDSWNDDLSPWVAEPIFGDAAFAGNAEKLLTRIKNEVHLAGANGDSTQIVDSTDYDNTS